MRPSLALLALVWLACASSIASHNLAAAQPGHRLDKPGSPQQAYDHALSLLRSTIKSRPRPSKHAPAKANSAASKEARLSSKQHSANNPTGFSLWDLVFQWTPIGKVYRVILMLAEVVTSSLGITSSIATSEMVSMPRSTSSQSQDPASKWLGPPIGATRDELRWQGARPLTLWPDWENLGDDNVAINPEDSPWDSVMFGPFHGGWENDAEDDSKGTAMGSSEGLLGKFERLLQHPAIPAVVRSKVEAAQVGTRKLFFLQPPWSQAKEKKKQSVRLEMEQRRRTAIEHLEWAAWGRNSIDWEYQAYSPSSSDPILIFSDALHASDHASTSQNASLPSNVQAHADALWVLAEHSLWGTHGAKPNLAKARACYQRLIDYGHDAQGTSRAGNASAHARLAFLDGSGWESTFRREWVSPTDDLDINQAGTDQGIRQAWKKRREAFARLKQEDGIRQAKAMLHYTHAAEAGDPPSQMALAFRHKAGIGTKPTCSQALGWYEKAAQDAYRRFQAGPPGGLTLPYTKFRLSDLAGGAYGPGASAASTGLAASKPAVQAALNHQPGTGGDPDGLEDMLEYHVYHAERGDAIFMLMLARVYYQGSIWAPGDAAGAVRRDYKRSMDYLLRITRNVWPKDAGVVGRGGPTGWTAKKGEKGEDIQLKVDDKLVSQAGAAASLIGRMHLRGEGVKQDFARAWVWFSRGSDTGDSDSRNGLGLMLRDGLGVKRDVSQAVAYFEAASKGRSAEGCANLAKVYIDMEDWVNAIKYLDLSIRWGNTFEAYYLIATVNARLARLQNSADRCRLATTGFKQTVERGDWASPMFHKAERAWRRGNKQKALLGWMLAGEMGFEAAQNNVAWILDRDKRRLRLSLDAEEDNSTDRLALVHWTRSAGQGNVDAMVKMGDYYFHGLGTGNPGRPAYDKAAACYSAAADKQVSALAYWNMGWMYEKGIGVTRQDFHLAKRYYDMAVEINEEAYLPVTLSLIKLHIRALWATVFRSDSSASAISLFSSYTAIPDSESAAYTEAEEIAQKNRKRVEAERLLEQGDGLGDPNEPKTWVATGQMDNEELDNIEGGLLVLALAALAYLAYMRQGVQLRLERERREALGRIAEEARQREEDRRVPNPWEPENGGNDLAGL